jgi:hypothetical protein
VKANQKNKNNFKDVNNVQVVPIHRTLNKKIRVFLIRLKETKQPDLT